MAAFMARFGAGGGSTTTSADAGGDLGQMGTGGDDDVSSAFSDPASSISLNRLKPKPSIEETRERHLRAMRSLRRNGATGGVGVAAAGSLASADRPEQNSGGAGSDYGGSGSDRGAINPSTAPRTSGNKEAVQQQLSQQADQARAQRQNQLSQLQQMVETMHQQQATAQDGKMTEMHEAVLALNDKQVETQQNLEKLHKEQARATETKSQEVNASLTRLLAVFEAQSAQIQANSQELKDIRAQGEAHSPHIADIKKGLKAQGQMLSELPPQEVRSHLDQLRQNLEEHSGQVGVALEEQHQAQMENLSQLRHELANQAAHDSVHAELSASRAREDANKIATETATDTWKEERGRLRDEVSRLMKREAALLNEVQKAAATAAYSSKGGTKAQSAAVMPTFLAGFVGAGLAGMASSAVQSRFGRQKAFVESRWLLPHSAVRPIISPPRYASETLGHAAATSHARPASADRRHLVADRWSGTALLAALAPIFVAARRRNRQR